MDEANTQEWNDAVARAHLAWLLYDFTSKRDDDPWQQPWDYIYWRAAQIDQRRWRSWVAIKRERSRVSDE